MSIAMSKREGSVRVALEGRTGIQEVKPLKHALDEAIAEGSEVELDLSGASEVDVSVLQLVHAMHCLSRHRGKRIVMAAEVPQAIAQFAADAGSAGVGCGRVCGEPRCVLEG